ncbi:hypothetical protein CF327_g2366 [Tilletia walkeri]|nr:hypothetical protein CF327_g2366 [Tilletia walkeri]
MANPRQRRKQRSSAASGSSNTSKRAQRKKLHRAPPLKGPAAAIIRDQWDRTKTIRQNYRALGLVGDGLALRPSGGGEKTALEAQAEAEAAAAEASSSAAAKGKGKATAEGSSKLRKGLGRIIRDEQGNVIDIIEGGEDEGGASSSSATPWGKPFNDWDELEDKEAPVQTDRAYLPEVVGPRTRAGEKIITSLEQRAAEAAPVVRHTSTLEASWLHSLVQAHGDDIEAMARDSKRNVWQKTTGEIRKAIKKAGGKEALLA